MRHDSMAPSGRTRPVAEVPATASRSAAFRSGSRACDGSGAPSGRRWIGTAGIFALVFTAFAIAAAPASAVDIGHYLTGSIEGSGTNALSTGITAAEVDNSTGPSHGDLYIADPTNHRVEKFSAAGNFILMFGDEVNATTLGDVCTAASGNTCKAGNPGTSAERLSNPTALTVDNSTGPSRGDVYVVEGESNTVHKYDENGNLMTSWGTEGVFKPSLFFTPKIAGIDVKPTNGQLVIVGSVSIVYLNQDGSSAGGIPVAFSEECGAFSSLPALSPDGVRIWRTPGSEVGFGYITTDWSPEGGGECVFNLTKAPGPPGSQGMNVDPVTGTLYVTETRQEFGTRVSEWRVNGEGKIIDANNKVCPGPECAPTHSFGFNQISAPKGLGINAATNTLYVVDAGNHRIAIFSPGFGPLPITEGPLGSREVSGTVKPDGAGEVIECYFEYGETIKYGKKQECAEGSNFTADTPVTALLSSVAPGQTYHYRLVAKNAAGVENFGEDKTITVTPNVHGLKTEPATEIERTAATFNAAFEGNGEDTTYFFEYGIKSVGENKTSSEDAGSPSGPESLSTPVTGLVPGSTYHYRVVAENGQGTTTGNVEAFNTPPSIKELQTEPATDVTDSSATLHGSLNPDGFATTYWFEYGLNTLYGDKLPLSPQDVGSSAPGTVDLSAAPTGLQANQTYHYRLVATNSTGTTFGNDESFVTAGPPSIVGLSSQNVTETSAELVGSINPSGYQTTYWFEYGTTTGYGSKKPLPPGTIDAGTVAEERTVQLTGLIATTYHFRLVAENKWGTATSEDQTFSFKPPQGCPNLGVRQQTGAAYLPDCRAYELVSPSRAGGSALHPIGPFSPYASSPGRFAYVGTVNGIPGTGEPINSTTGDLYVASRTNSGWVSKYVGLPGWKAGADGPPRWKKREFGGGCCIEDMGPGGLSADRGLDKFVVFSWGNKTTLPNYTKEGNYVSYLYDNEGRELDRLPTNFEEIPGSTTDVIEGGFIGDATLSGDGKQYIFGSNTLAFTPDGLAEAPGSIYDDEIETGSITVISKTESGEDIHGDPLVAGGEELISVLGVSPDGSHVVMATKAASRREHLYMSVDGTEHFEVSKGQDGKNHGVKFAGMTEDGTVVYFTSDEQLTSEDTDSSTDVYKWTEATHEVSLVSLGSGGSGNSSNCPSIEHWATGCGVEVVPTPLRGTEIGGGAAPSANSVASKTGDLYFYSPERLDGSRGATGARNLYVYREGKVQFVAALDASSPAETMNVAPNGSHMGLITRTDLTPYDSAGHAEMYVYSPASQSIKCVSCLPDGSPPSFDVKGAQNGIFMTEDGRAFFSTKDSLVEQDADGITDVYEFTDGRPQLISSGTGDNEGSQEEDGSFFQGAGLVGVSEDGTDVFFSTFNTLVPQDENGGLFRFYDARTGGGFPYNKPPAPCAAADECHGPGASAPPNPVIGTGAQLGSRGNVPTSKQRRHAACKVKKRKGKRSACHRKSRKKQTRGQRRG